MPMILGNAKIYKFEHIEVLVARYKHYNDTQIEYFQLYSKNIQV